MLFFPWLNTGEGVLQVNVEHLPFRILADGNEKEIYDGDSDGEINDLVIPNKYYKPSKYSKVGFKGGLKKKLETQEERLARTYNIMAPMPKEELVNMQENGETIEPELLANMDKYIKAKIAEEEASEKRNQEEKEKQKKPTPQKQSLKPPKEDYKSKCPNAILIDKSMLFSTPLDEYVVVGKILKPHGLKGHVKVRALCNDPEIRLCEPGYRFLKFEMRDDTVMPIKIEYGRLFDGIKTYRLKLEGIDSKDQALRLNGAYLSVSLRDVPPLEEDCYYSRDLLNLDVYLFNDDSKTKLGKVVGFRHREDLVSMPKLASITEDLLEVEMDIKLSLSTLMALTKASKDASDESETRTTTSKTKGVSVITDRDLDTAEEVINAEEELGNSNMAGIHYVKYYVCSICKKEFTNHSVALEHDRAHEAGALPEISEQPETTQESDGNSQEEKIYTLDEYYQKNIKRPLRRFYIPLIKEETVKFVDVPNKSIYVETYTIFIGEDGNKITA
ncbi:ribosome maturation factor RIMM like protein [Babesia gibsoni]|uniref:Ribosome maturation factor RIMM like protein n=1 Tax=Babesia gibsoni TaxID=33632 RepID=A0AAD8UWD2_BABGI|nr:ribosome maturation factor RIMM like protein [Babesia gibsoni]